MTSHGCREFDLVNITFKNLRHTTSSSDETEICKAQYSICLVGIHRWDDTLTHSLCKKSIHARCLMKWQITQHRDAPFNRQAYKSNMPSHCANKAFHRLYRSSLTNPDMQGPCIDCPMENIEGYLGFFKRTFAAAEMIRLQQLLCLRLFLSSRSSQSL